MSKNASRDPSHYLLEDDDASARMTFWWIEAFSRVVKSALSDGLEEKIEARTLLAMNMISSLDIKERSSLNTYPRPGEHMRGYEDLQWWLTNKT
ncbi:hypothetical protein BYT27DRAFT_7183241 [Phlegmacium glaucopus]|nr:hypothetical protein BYT27DRAFT_7183241 [Phlegmacium glaucopus]